MSTRKKPHAFVQQDVDLHLMASDEYIRNCVEGQKSSVVTVIQILLDNGHPISDLITRYKPRQLIDRVHLAIIMAKGKIVACLIIWKMYRAVHGTVKEMLSNVISICL